MNQMRENANIGHLICTSTSRPAAPDEGTMIYETDTDLLYVWTGAAWLQVRRTTDSVATSLLTGTIPTSTLTGTVANANLPDGAPGWFAFGRVAFPTGVNQSANLVFNVPYRSEVLIQASVSGYGGPGLARQYLVVYGVTGWTEGSYYYFNFAGDHRTLPTGGLQLTLNAGNYTAGTYILNINTDVNDQASYSFWGRKIA
jgi:hypothetical protein